jgi:hypothetical protein
MCVEPGQPPEALRRMGALASNSVEKLAALDRAWATGEKLAVAKPDARWKSSAHALIVVEQRPTIPESKIANTCGILNSINPDCLEP